MMADPVLTALPSAFFALLWGTAATHKALSWSLFRQQLADYRVLPRRLNDPAAALLPLLEAALALGWLAAATRPAAALLSAALLSSFAAAMAWNLRQGRDSIDCGCGGDAGQTIRWALAVRNLLLAAAALAVLPLTALAATRTMGWLDWLSVDAGALCLMGMYLIVNQILANLPPQRALR